MSITPLLINSLNSDSWYVSNDIASTALERIEAEYVLYTRLIMNLRSFRLMI